MAATPKTATAAATPVAEQETQPAAAPAPTRNVYQRIAQVMATVGAIPKDGTMRFGGGGRPETSYQYMKTSTLLAYLRGAMAAAGLVLEPRLEHLETVAGGRSGSLLSARYTMIMTNADDPTDRVETPWPAQAEGGDDKSYAKLITNVQKTYLKALFLISDEDPDEARANAAADLAPAPQMAAPRAVARGPLETAQRSGGVTSAPVARTSAPPPPEMDSAGVSALRQQVLDALAADHNSAEASAKMSKGVIDQNPAELTLSLAWLRRRATGSAPVSAPADASA